MGEPIKTTDGCTINWREDGVADGPIIIFSNSLGTNLAMWDGQVEALKSTYRIIRYDTRGHGWSSAPGGEYSIDRLGLDVLDLADALDLKAFHFCGLSLGGMIGQWLGYRAPQRLLSLVIANSAAYMGPPSVWQSRINLVNKSGLGSIVDAAMGKWFTPEFIAESDKMRAVRDMFLRTERFGYTGACAAIRDMDMRPVLSLITSRTLVLGGTKDPATPPNQTNLLRDSIKAAQCVMLDAAHLSNVERPEAFNATLKNHLKKKGENDA